MSARIECLRAKYPDSSGFDTQRRLKFLREETERGLPSKKVLHAIAKRDRADGIVELDPGFEHDMKYVPREIRSIAAGLFRQ